MTYLERYKTGECETVWLEIGVLRESELNTATLEDVQVVTLETIRRVKYNLELIVGRLEKLGFEFGAETEDQTNYASYMPPVTGVQPIKPLDEDVQATLTELSRVVGGVVPMVFRVFAEQIGSVDLRGIHPRFKTDYLLDALMVEVFVPEADEVTDWLEYETENPEILHPTYKHPFSLDEFHKENVSGGQSYSIALPDDCIDPPVLYVPFEGTLTAYLRDAILSYAGFPGFADMPTDLLEHLREGLVEF
jgi:hypothetical protein